MHFSVGVYASVIRLINTIAIEHMGPESGTGGRQFPPRSFPRAIIGAVWGEVHGGGEGSG